MSFFKQANKRSRSFLYKWNRMCFVVVLLFKAELNKINSSEEK